MRILQVVGSIPAIGQLGRFHGKTNGGMFNMSTPYVKQANIMRKPIIAIMMAAYRIRKMKSMRVRRYSAKHSLEKEK